jgi:hypothetical protein
VLADVDLHAERRVRLRRDLVRSLGAIVTILVGPATGLIAWRIFGMGPLEAVALLFLISGWIGPRLMARPGR